MRLWGDSESEVVIFLEQVRSPFSDGHLRTGCRLYSWEPFGLVEDDPAPNDNVTVVELVSVDP
jgi:hypothetical protein